MLRNNWGLRELYNTWEVLGKNPLREVHKLLDESVREAYGMRKNEDILKILLNLNKEIYKKEQKDLKVTGPGLPLRVKNSIEFISQDYIKAPSRLI